MRWYRKSMNSFSLLVILLGGAACSSMPEPKTNSSGITSITEASWQLVQFQGGDDTLLKPDDKSKYTLTFNTDGSVAARIDCNRGRGTWKSIGTNQLELGPLALTRAMCPPGSMHDRIVRHWPYVRSYRINNGHLFLSLQADGGIYEFEAQPQPASR